MSRPFLNIHLTAEAVLAYMEPGREYLSLDIADHFEVKPHAAWTIMRELKADGQIKRITAPNRTVRWVKIDTRVKEALETSIAQPIAAPDLRAEIKGYTDEIQRRVALCMSIGRRFA